MVGKSLNQSTSCTSFQKRGITNGYIQLPDKKIQVYLHKRGEVYYVNVGPDEDGMNMVVKYYDTE